MEVYDGFPVPIVSHLPALRDLLLSDASDGTTTVVAGFEVIRYEDPSDPSLSVMIAQRGDRLLIVQSIPMPALEAILAAMPA